MRGNDPILSGAEQQRYYQKYLTVAFCDGVSVSPPRVFVRRVALIDLFVPPG